MLKTQTLGRSAYQADMTMPQIPAAGITTKLNETAKDALSWNTAERPQTPPEIRKYRQTAIHEPGKMARHFGAADDPVPQGPFGCKSAAAAGQTVVEAIRNYPESEMARWRLEQAESIYARCCSSQTCRTAELWRPSKQQ